MIRVACGLVPAQAGKAIGETDSDNTMHEEARVVYSYNVGGAVHNSNRIGCITIGTASQLLGRYPVGKQVEVYYNPADPSSSVLQR